MAFVSTGTTHMTVAFTPIGRQYLLGKRKLNGTPKNGITVAFFTLTDSDRNYLIDEAFPLVVATTGQQEECLNGTRTTQDKNTLIF